jgi:3-hydroxyacyl-CoA dehydrogenase
MRNIGKYADNVMNVMRENAHIQNAIFFKALMIQNKPIWPSMKIVILESRFSVIAINKMKRAFITFASDKEKERFCFTHFLSKNTQTTQYLEFLS